MKLIRSFSPMMLFVALLMVSGIYFSLRHVPDAFYKLPAVVAILPAIVLAWVLRQDSIDAKVTAFLDGARHKDIMMMCVIFLLVGAFAALTTGMGCVDAAVQFCFQFVSARYLLVGLFMVTAIVATSIGTSMGAVAAVTPIGIAMSSQMSIDLHWAVATVVGGAMLGDNLSIVSDTTIAAVATQSADLRKKFFFNLRLSAVAALVTTVFLVMPSDHVGQVSTPSFPSILLIPHLCLLALALYGLHPFLVLTLSLMVAIVIAVLGLPEYGLDKCVLDIARGFTDVHEIMILSILIGGMSGLIGRDAVNQIAIRIEQWMHGKESGRREAELVIASLSALFDVLLANNTIAILMIGPMAKQISSKYRIPAHVSAVWLDVASCIFQGIIPYGAQILLASSLARVSPFTVMPYVLYCYVLLVTMVMYIVFRSRPVP